MPIRVLSGVVNVRTSRGQGSVTIGFNPHLVIAATERATVFNMCEVGPAANFVAEPCRTVSLRQISKGHSILEGEARWALGETISTTELVIRWSRTGLAGIEEIAYMAIGEVPDDLASRIEPG